MFQGLYKPVDTIHLLGDIDALRTFLHADATIGAMVGLTELGHRTVVTNEEGSTKFPIVRLHGADGHAVFVDAFVEMQKDAGNVDAIRTRHTILAIVAWDERIADKLLSRRIQKVHIVLSEWFQW